MKRFFQNAGKPDFAIDFGTANTRIVTADGGVQFDEPSLCCFSGQNGRVELVAAGSEAVRMQDRTVGDLRMVRPLNRGVLSDIPAARDFLAYAVRSTVGQRRLRSFRAIIGVPADATNAERGALITAAHDAGIGSVELLAEPLAAAWGANIEVNLPQGRMIVECGAGTTEAAVLSLSGICATASVRGGGDAIDAAIADYLHFNRKFLISHSMAEKIKCDVAGSYSMSGDSAKNVTIKGRSLVTGLPEALLLPVEEFFPVLEKHTVGITEMVVNLLGRLSAELSHDVHNNGIVLSGGCAAIGVARSALEDATGLNVFVAPNPTHCVAIGLHKALLN